MYKIFIPLSCIVFLFSCVQDISAPKAKAGTNSTVSPPSATSTLGNQPQKGHPASTLAVPPVPAASSSKSQKPKASMPSMPTITMPKPVLKSQPSLPSNTPMPSAKASCSVGKCAHARSSNFAKASFSVGKSAYARSSNFAKASCSVGECIDAQSSASVCYAYAFYASKTGGIGRSTHIGEQFCYSV